MNKAEINVALTTNHNRFAVYTNGLSKVDLLFSKTDKWTAAQQVDHIFKSIKPLAQGLLLPKFVVKLVWGKANRDSKTYEGLVNKYNEKLKLGGKATKPFVPSVIDVEAVPQLNQKILQAINRLIKNLEKFKEEELDSFILPHPLLGKVTLREMMYFTIYHVQHHEVLIKNALLKN
jgi:DinB superfamily